MKKTLIALSLAALSGAAFADVTLYGQIKAGVEVSRTKTVKNDVATKSHVDTRLADFGSRIGFKGHESLGNGINAIWKMEQSTPVHGARVKDGVEDVTDKTLQKNAWGNRQAYIGLETAFGTVRAGKVPTQLDDMGKVDPWEYDNAVTHHGALGGFDSALGLAKFTRTGDKVLSVRYDSPVVAGFSGNIQFTPRDNNELIGRNVDPNTLAADKKQGTKAAYHAGLNYENAGFFAQYGAALKKNAVATNRDYQAHRLEAGYDANNLLVAVGLQYEKAAAKTKEVAVTAAYTLGNVTPKVSYAHGWTAKDYDGNRVPNTLYNQVVVGADYDFSKRTAAFAQAGWLKVGGKDDYKASTSGLVGLKHKF